MQDLKYFFCIITRNVYTVHTFPVMTQKNYFVRCNHKAVSTLADMSASPR